MNIPYGGNIYRFSDLMRKASSDPVTLPVENPDEVALLQYTGERRDLRKGATLTDRNLVANTLQCAAWVYRGRRGKEKTLGVLPFFMFTE